MAAASIVVVLMTEDDGRPDKIRLFMLQRYSDNIDTYIPMYVMFEMFWDYCYCETSYFTGNREGNYRNKNKSPFKLD